MLVSLVPRKSHHFDVLPITTTTTATILLVLLFASHFHHRCDAGSGNNNKNKATSPLSWLFKAKLNEQPFLKQLQAWAQHTLRRKPTEIVAEFNGLGGPPKPEKSPVFNGKQLNRYPDVPCTLATRVHLKNYSHDYIHANWIDDGAKGKKFIATQAPLEHTIDDFWHMVAQEQVDAILVLCNVGEVGTQKCSQYWPSPDAKKPMTKTADGQIEVKFLGRISEKEPDKEIQESCLQLQTMPTQKPGSNSARVRRTITLLHWLHWPDRGVPRDLVEPLRLMHYLLRFRRVVVHCSAGIGRTGTVLAVHSALEHLQAGKELNIAQIVRDLRAQRTGSVQTQEQYLYLYSVFLGYAKHFAAQKELELDVPKADQLLKEFGKTMSG